MKKTLLSGIKSTGRPHIGNYFGAMKQFIDLQDQYNSYIFIADLHALTTIHDKKELEQLTLDLAIDYLAIGLNPKKVTLFKQSDVPQVTELAWIFSCITTMPYLMRAHAFKDSEAKDKEINAGVFNYPMLMTADILLPQADIVPVGKDQKQHIEIARNTAEKFNRIFGKTFKLPEERILDNTSTVLGTDGQKMSKSYKNTIPLFANYEELKKIVMSIPTDSKGIDERKDPDSSNIFNIHKLLLTKDRERILRKRYREPGLSYKEAKELLLNDLDDFITPLRLKRKEVAENPKKVLKLLQKNGKKMFNKSEKIMTDIRKKIGISI